MKKLHFLLTDKCMAVPCLTSPLHVGQFQLPEYSSLKNTKFAPLANETLMLSKLPRLLWLSFLVWWKFIGNGHL